MAEDFQDWRSLLLEAIGAPRNHMNLTALGAWEASEGMPLWANNELAASDDFIGAKSYPPAPAIKIYPTVDAEVQVYTFKFNSSIYRPIRDALRASESYQDIFDAINQSPWCAGCQGDKYPIRLWEIVFGRVAPQPPAADKKPEHEWVIPAEKTPNEIRELHRSWDQLTRAYGHVLPAALYKSRQKIKRFGKAVS